MLRTLLATTCGRTQLGPPCPGEVHWDVVRTTNEVQPCCAAEKMPNRWETAVSDSDFPGKCPRKREDSAGKIQLGTTQCNSGVIFNSVFQPMIS